jgi:hypothetical protein
VFFRGLLRTKFRPVAVDVPASVYSDYPVPPLPNQKEGADA